MDGQVLPEKQSYFFTVSGFNFLRAGSPLWLVSRSFSLLENMNLKIIALIHSDYNGVADHIQAEVPILKGSMHYLERGRMSPVSNFR